MKNIENWFLENKEHLNNEEPEAGHFERFAQKMQQQKSAATRNPFKVYYLAASAAMIVVLISLTVFLTTKYVNNTQAVGLANVSAEYKEVDSFYSGQINAGLKKIEKLQCSSSKEEVKELDGELKDLDDSYLKLAKELNDNKNNEQIIEAMILNLKTKAELVSLILNKLQNNC